MANSAPSILVTAADACNGDSPELARLGTQSEPDCDGYSAAWMCGVAAVPQALPQAMSGHPGCRTLP